VPPGFARSCGCYFPTLLPFVALSSFAALRTSELVSIYANEEPLQWDEGSGNHEPKAAACVNTQSDVLPGHVIRAIRTLNAT
jgi:hypothetical protein